MSVATIAAATMPPPDPIVSTAPSCAAPASSTRAPNIDSAPGQASGGAGAADGKAERDDCDGERSDVAHRSSRRRRSAWLTESDAAAWTAVTTPPPPYGYQVRRDSISAGLGVGGEQVELVLCRATEGLLAYPAAVAVLAECGRESVGLAGVGREHRTLAVEILAREVDDELDLVVAHPRGLLGHPHAELDV